MDDIVLKLQGLGFTSYEAKAYCALIKKHPANGYEVSRVARVPPAKIYETLNRLRNKGVVVSSSTEPVMYYPVPPGMVLARLKQEYVATIEDLDVRLQGVKPFPDLDLTWNLSGYQVVLDKMAELINRAEGFLLLSIWPEEAGLLQGPVLKAEERGVKVICGVFGDSGFRCGNTVNLEPCGSSSEKRLGARLTVAVGDSKEVVISEFGTRDETVGVWTTTPGIVLVAKEYIKHDIWGRVLVDAVGESEFNRMCRENEMLSFLINNR
ncbi:MAG: TrmB family transcriptional regulator [Firmicutes bacterium]|nr:TrmB family transcriptional regulator [Bacillota bacterium]